MNELDLLIRDAVGDVVTAPPEFTGIHLVRYIASLFVDENRLASENLLPAVEAYADVAPHP